MPYLRFHGSLQNSNRSFGHKMKRLFRNAVKVLVHNLPHSIGDLTLQLAYFFSVHRCPFCVLPPNIKYQAAQYIGISTTGHRVG